MLFPGDASRQGRHAGAYDPSTSKAKGFLISAIVIVLLCLLAWPFVEPYMLETENTVLTADHLPAAVGQLNVVFVSDIHKGSSFTDARVRDLIGRINACNADIVLLGGDYAQDSAGAVAFFQSMPTIHAKYGVFAVVGENDNANLTQLTAAAQKKGVQLLNNAVQPVRIGTSTIHIAGVNSTDFDSAALSRMAGQVRAEDYVILLGHSPVVIPEAMKCTDSTGRGSWFDLGLFGHTHGGQVALLGNLRDTGVPERYMRGWLRENRIDLLISNGVGTTGFPVRLLRRPQIHHITVRSGQ